MQDSGLRAAKVVDDPFAEVPKDDGRKVFRFVKTVNPREVLTGLGVVFHVAVDGDGRSAPEGSYETKDPVMASKIRQWAASHPNGYVSEL